MQVNSSDLSVYQIFPRTFFDSNGDGIGDLAGITEKVSYIKSLGVNTILLYSVFSSSEIDADFDVVDFYKLDKKIGEFDDLNNLIETCHMNGLKVVFEIGLSNTSCMHEWFTMSKNQEEYRDFYFWRQTKNNKIPDKTQTDGLIRANAWDFCQDNQMWYFFFNNKFRPTINAFSPLVIKEFDSILEFWLNKGIDGFMFTGFDEIMKSSKYMLKLKDENGKQVKDNSFQNRILPLLKHYKTDIIAKHNALMLCQIDNLSLQDKVMLFGKHKICDCLVEYNKFNVNCIKKNNLLKLCRELDFHQCTSYLGLNQSICLESPFTSRIVNRMVATEKMGDKGLKALAVLSLTLNGVPFIMQGQELGQTDGDYLNDCNIKDFQCKELYNHLLNSKKLSPSESLNRVNKVSFERSRMPIHWDYKINGGFSSSSETWLPVDKYYSDINAYRQEHIKESLLNFYRSVHLIRNNNIALMEGLYNKVNCKNNKVIAFSKKTTTKECMIMCNLSEEVQKIQLPLYYQNKLRTPLIGNYVNIVCGAESYCLRPYEAVIYIIEDMPEKHILTNDEKIKILKEEKKQQQKETLLKEKTYTKSQKRKE